MKHKKRKNTEIKQIESNFIGNLETNRSGKPVKISTYAWKLLIILSCTATMVMYAETMLIPAIPTLIHDFDVTYGLSSWLLTAYLVSGAVMTPIVGKLSDIYGRKRILLIVMAIYAVGVTCAGFSNDIFVMIIARAIQGVGMSMFPIAFGIIRDQFPREKVSIAQGIITSMFATGAVIGLSIGGIIIQHFGWRMTFFTIIPISIMLIIVIRKFVHLKDNYLPDAETNDPTSSSKPIRHGKRVVNMKKDGKELKVHIDIKGSILLAVTITSFLLAITLLQSTSINDEKNGNSIDDFELFFNFLLTYKTVLPFLMTAIISLILFIYIEKRTSFPLMDFKIFLSPPILLSSIIIMIVGLSMFMVFQTIPILVQSPEPIGFGENAISTGKIQLPFAIVLLIFGPTSGFIISKLGSMKPIIFGSILTTTGFIMILLFNSSEMWISAGLAILSAGLSLAAVGAMNVVILAVPREHAGVTIGMSSMLRIVGSSIGPALAAMYMQTNQSIIRVNGIPQAFPSSYSFDLIFLSAVILSTLSVALSIILRSKMNKTLIHV